MTFEEDMKEIDDMINTKYNSFMNSDAAREEIATLVVENWKEIKKRLKME